MSNESIFKPAHSPCKLCSFAKYEGITQTDCYLGFIDKYRNNHIEIIEAYDEDKEFYVINGKKCFGYKEDNYFKSRNLENSSIEEKIEYVKSKLKINYVAVVNVKMFSLKELSEVFNTMSQLSVKPKNIVLVRYQDDKNIYPYEELKTLLDNKMHNIKWRIQTIIDSQQSYEDCLHVVTNTHKKNNFILSINGDYSNLSNIINYAQDAVYEKFTFFGVLSNASRKTIFYNSIVYRTGIFHGIDIFTKQEEYQIV